MVQGVGYRYFFARQVGAATRYFAGYVKNLSYDGRGGSLRDRPRFGARISTPQNSNAAQTAHRFAAVTEEEAPVDSKFAARFTVEARDYPEPEDSMADIKERDGRSQKN